MSPSVAAPVPPVISTVPSGPVATLSIWSCELDVTLARGVGSPANAHAALMRAATCATVWSPTRNATLTGTPSISSVSVSPPAKPAGNVPPTPTSCATSAPMRKISGPRTFA